MSNSASFYDTQGFLTDPVAIALFIAFLILFTAYLLWANTRQDDEIEAALRRASRGHVDPDDLTEALLFERKQARTAKAIKGERE